MTSFPTGKGMYLWILDRLGSPATLVKSLKSAGIQWVAIKLQSGRLISDGRASEEFEHENPDIYIKMLKDAGIAVHGWGYVYGKFESQVRLEIETAVKSFNRFKVDSWCINAEVEYKTDKTPPELAELLVHGIRQSLPGVPLGYTTYRYPEYHKTFNWGPFVKYCDYASPQIYWVGATNPAAQLDKCISQYRTIGSTVPVIPIGCAYSDNGWDPTPAQMHEFYSHVVDLNLLGWSWWEWKYIIDHPTWLSAITAHAQPPNTGQDNPINSNTIEQVKDLATLIMMHAKDIVSEAEKLKSLVTELERKG